VHEVELVHETPFRALLYPGTSGLPTIDQLVPFQDSIKVWEVVLLK
jgi:hypothetical protein